MFHTHRFVEQERIYAGRVKLTGCGDGAVEDIERLLFGITTIISKCDECGTLQTVEVKGDARKTAVPRP